MSSFLSLPVFAIELELFHVNFIILWLVSTEVTKTGPNSNYNLLIQESRFLESVAQSIVPVFDRGSSKSITVEALAKARPVTFEFGRDSLNAQIDLMANASPSQKTALLHLLM